MARSLHATEAADRSVTAPSLGEANDKHDPVPRNRNRLRPRTPVLGPGRDRPVARPRPRRAGDVQGAAAATRARSSTRGCTSTRRPGRSRWSASTPWSRTPTRSSATSRASSSFPPRRCRTPSTASTGRAASCGSSSTSWSTARRRCRCGCIPSTRRCSSRAASARRSRRTSSTPTSPRARRASRCARPRRRRSCSPSSSRRAGPTSTACSSWLRGDEDGARTMRDAVASIEDVTAQSSAALVLVERGRAVRGDRRARRSTRASALKQLAARIDLQIRRVAEGGDKVADRLRREVLYYVAISAPVGPAGARPCSRPSGWRA